MERHPLAPPIVLGVLLSSSLLVRCASERRDASRLFSRADAAVTATGGRPSILASTGGASIAGQSGYVNTGRRGTCTADTVESSCPIPDPLCVDAETLAVFTSPACVDGDCRWAARIRTCTGNCADGGCAVADASAADAGDCDLPPSACIDPTRLLYFNDARRVDGLCRADARIEPCSAGNCAEGACQYPVTAH